MSTSSFKCVRCVRPAKKAGSWYTKEANALSKQFKSWLSNSNKSVDSKLIKAIICPHAGYTFCGPTAAYSYRHVNPSKIKRIFILGPDHCGAAHSGKHRCMLSKASHWETPFGDIAVDTDIVSALYKTKCFDLLSMKQDAREHSMELIVPFLSFMYYSNYGAEEKKSQNMQEWNAMFKIIPIMVGNCRQRHHELYGKILAPYFEDENTLFIISSDFCHWGQHYGYTPFDKESYGKEDIHAYIKDLDAMAIEYLEELDYNGFVEYLDNTQNTICGQHPICVLLNIVMYYEENIKKKKKKNEKRKYEMKFINYTQSSKVTNKNEYSVSYASGILYQCDDKEENEEENDNKNEKGD